MFTLRDWWICVIDSLRCANDGAGSSHRDVKLPCMTLDRLANGERIYWKLGEYFCTLHCTHTPHLLSLVSPTPTVFKRTTMASSALFRPIYPHPSFEHGDRQWNTLYIKNKLVPFEHQHTNNKLANSTFKQDDYVPWLSTCVVPQQWMRFPLNGWFTCLFWHVARIPYLILKSSYVRQVVAYLLLILTVHVGINSLHCCIFADTV